MPNYMAKPQVKVTVGTTEFTNRQAFNVKVDGFENGFPQATLSFSDQYGTYRGILAKKASVKVEVKDARESSYTTLFTGKARFRTESVTDNGEVVTLQCDGLGYGFAETVCAEEYGTQSRHASLDTLAEVLTDGTNGVIPLWVNKILGGATDSGFSYSTSYVDTITGTIRYLYFPYKPNSKVLGDICSIVQAIKGASAGPHWIFTPTGNLIVTTVASHSAAAIAQGYPTYLGGSTSEATLKQGIDFLPPCSFEDMTSEANSILYHSNWLWPCNGDTITENDTNWSDTNMTFSADNTVYKVGAYSVKGIVTVDDLTQNIAYPDSGSLGLDLTKAGGEYNIPHCTFFLRRNATFDIGSEAVPGTLAIYFYKGVANYTIALLNMYKLTPSADTWVKVDFPIGPYWQNDPAADATVVGISDVGAGGWDEVNTIYFSLSSAAVDTAFWIDGFTFAGWCLRRAYNSTKITADGVKTRVINDPYGKDDSMIASDDSGSVARYACAELLRSQTEPVIGSFKTPLIKNLHPGQLLKIYARPTRSGSYGINNVTYRSQQYTHLIIANELSTTHTVTSDVINSMSRAAFDSKNEADRAVRPEFQDKQATGMKMRDIDITQAILEKDYPS